MIVEPEVVGEFASGSHEAFHKIFKLFYPKVYAFIRGFIKDLDDSEDLKLLIDMVVNENPPKRKMIYKLSRIKRLSNEQIAEKMGIQKKTVENHLNIALNELRDALALSILVYLILSV